MHEGRKLGFLPNDNRMDGLLCDELVIGARATLCPTLLSPHLHIINLLLFYRARVFVPTLSSFSETMRLRTTS